MCLPTFSSISSLPTGNVVKSLERKLDEEAGRGALKPATLPDGRLPKADTTVGVELDWLRNVRSRLEANPLDLRARSRLRP